MVEDSSWTYVPGLKPMILLSVGHLEVDWNRNNFSSDHSQLFQASDLSTVPYYYVDPSQPYGDDE